MRCWVYRSPIGSREWLLTREWISMCILPIDVQMRFRHAEVEKTIDVKVCGRFKGLNVNDVIGNITNNKFHVIKAEHSTIDGWPGVIGIDCPNISPTSSRKTT